MQSSAKTDKVDKRLGLDAMSWYRWKCRCCGPKSGKDRQMYHQAERTKVKELLREELSNPENFEVDYEIPLDKT